MAKLNQDKNQPEKVPEEYQGKKILKVLQVIIGEDKSFYRCVLDDGTIENVPAKLFE